MSFRAKIVAGLAAAGLCGAAHAQTFNLSTVPSGTTPTFSITAGGNTATFSSVPGNGFSVGSDVGLQSFSPALTDTNFSEDPLTISFSAPVRGTITIPFFVEDLLGFGPDTLSVTTNTMASYSFTALPDGQFEPEGQVRFTPTSAVSSLTLTSAFSFGIGNVTVPEPASLSLLGLGVAGLIAARRRSA